MIDVLLLLIVAGVAWCVASDGAWGAGLTFLSVIFGGLLAMTFFESLSTVLTRSMPGMGMYWDFISLFGLFGAFTTLFRIGSEQISPIQIELDGPVYQATRWVFSILTGYTTMAILLTALHTAPLPRDFLGFTPERANLFNTFAPDRQWLGFTQHISEKVLVTGRIFDGDFRPPTPGAKPAVWSTFPIRYASLRDAYARGGGLATAGKQSTPRSGGGGGGGGGGNSGKGGF